MSIAKLMIVAIVLLIGALPAHAGDIHQAIREGDVDLVAKMLQEDPTLVTVQAENQTRDLPLHTAASEGQLKIAKLLLKAGAEVDGGDSDQSTPLDVAALRGQKEMVELLINKGADVNHRDNNGAYSLSFAAFSGNAEIVDILLQAGADLNYENPRGVTLLHAASSRGLVDFFDLLVTKGADVNVATTEGETPLHWAAGRGQTVMVEKLLAAGADPSAKTVHGQTILMQLAFAEDVTVAQPLIAAGAEVDAVDTGNRTALMLTSWRGNTELAKILLAAGADPNHQDDSGTTALISAIFQGHGDLVDVLLAGGAKTEIKENRHGCTALHAAAIKGYPEIAAALLASGADIEAVNSAGFTPLQVAARYQQKKVAKTLLANGASKAELDNLPPNPGVACKVKSGEAAVWYLGHSAWAVKTQNRLLIFDYWDQGQTSADPCLCNGHICAKEIGDLDVAVFASHEHGDHYDPLIFGWREKIPNIKYFLGCQPADAASQDYVYVGPRQTRTVDGMKIVTIESNDSGVGWVVEVDGVQIYHAGDHANRHQDFSGPYQAEIDYLADLGVKPDLAFMPISGCGFGDQEAVKMGVHYAIETLQPAVFIPMHSGGNSFRYHEFVGDCEAKFPQTEMLAVDFRGDHFLYAGGKIGSQASLTD